MARATINWDEARRLAASGLTQSAVAKALGCSGSRISRKREAAGLAFRKPRRAPPVDRTEVMGLARSGFSTRKIGVIFNCSMRTIQRVRAEFAPDVPQAETTLPAWAKDFEADYRAAFRAGGEFFAAAEVRRLKRLTWSGLS